ncbi:MAG: hypothetical protein NDI77_07260 [Geobacteraceae bacterium]|nr:hypothetical protein [Geobacteraceae bacterium]
MKGHTFREVIIFVVTLLLLAMPALLQAQGGEADPGPPPIGQPMVSEGTFAVQLAAALGLAETDDEVEAESRLGEAGIAPRNGWIADYPVTPDIIAELQLAVEDAAVSGRIALERDEALGRFDDVAAGLGLTVKPHSAGQTYEGAPPSCANYPNPAVIRSTYTAEGAPVVTYYCPPPDYYNSYAWVPSPFWWGAFWFPGFFILHDFDRVVHLHGKGVVIRNRFHDDRSRRVFRIDPVARFRGKTFAGIGVPDRRGHISTGVSGSERRIFNESGARRGSGGRSIDRPSRGGKVIKPFSGGGRRGGSSQGGGRGRR